MYKTKLKLQEKNKILSVIYKFQKVTTLEKDKVAKSLKTLILFQFPNTLHRLNGLGKIIAWKKYFPIIT